MTKKDYVLIAKVFSTTARILTDARAQWLEKEAHGNVGNPAVMEKIDGINKILASLDVIVQGLCHELKKENPKFDALRFQEACGLPKIKNNEIYPVE